MKTRLAVDLSGLPPFGFDNRSPIWWGTLGFVAIEGMGFVLAVGLTLYLKHVNPHWPMDAAPPDLLPGTLLTGVLLASLWFNRSADKAARDGDLSGTRLWLVVMTVVGLATIGLRLWEFNALNVRWDQNAYGSCQWLLLGLHATHLITDVGDTAVLTALMFTKHGRGKRYSDVSDNAFYWSFVVAAWIPIYGLVYWVPRW
ncbi:cytochrome c oxidase subunit 3 [uncultured Alsobacter sp.]|uniref:cytochrome c oxidase subunit 3 n=1 Tax=uncultured Alsobacter sp. TaxID=1748258 RepID=UPI0025E35CCB|nr:cytochrome c oxidase subunit 3 [uncultured Alsobacter sp.]